MVDRRPPVRLGVHVYAEVKVEAEVQQFPVPRRATCGCTAYQMTITPAMAPDGWAKLQDTKTCESEIYEGKLLANNVVVENRHAVAALALHGQPFGFTWDHVIALEYAIEASDQYIGHDVPSHDDLVSLKDRIAALLPPRTEGT